MGILSNHSGKDVAKAFARAGWQREGQSGSHLIMTKEGVAANLSIPQHKEVAPGTLRGLIRSAGLTVEAFLELL